MQWVKTRMNLAGDLYTIERIKELVVEEAAPETLCTKLLKSLEHRDKRERVEAFDLDAALEAARAAPRAQRGDVWELGDHRLD